MKNSELLNEYVAPNVVSALEKQISDILKKAGIYHRLFSRAKSPASILEKIKRKGYPTPEGKIMQDIIGIRIALYFVDDVSACRQIIETVFNSVGTEATELDPKVFAPERLNIVCKIPDHLVDYIAPELWSNYPVDKTFEVQIRTVFSEGWHEIEHDVRYKSLSDWDAQPDLSRNLNGILATLETCDWSIISILDDLAYREYKNRKWAEMMKNKLRIHLIDTSLDERILGIFDNKPEVAKSFLKIDRRAFLFYLSCESKMLVPLTLSNIVFVANLLWINNSDLLEITPKVFKEIIIKYG